MVTPLLLRQNWYPRNRIRFYPSLAFQMGHCSWLTFLTVPPPATLLAGNTSKITDDFSLNLLLGIFVKSAEIFRLLNIIQDAAFCLTVTSDLQWNAYVYTQFHLLFPLIFIRNIGIPYKYRSNWFPAGVQLGSTLYSWIFYVPANTARNVIGLVLCGRSRLPYSPGNSRDLRIIRVSTRSCFRVSGATYDSRWCISILISIEAVLDVLVFSFWIQCTLFHARRAAWNQKCTPDDRETCCDLNHCNRKRRKWHWATHTWSKYTS